MRAYAKNMETRSLGISLLLSILLSLSVVLAKDYTLQSCDEEGTENADPGVDGGVLNLIGCPDSFIILDVLPIGDENVGILLITDTDSGRVLANVTEQPVSIGFSVASNGPSITVECSSAIEVTFAGKPFLNSIGAGVFFGNDSIEVEFEKKPNTRGREILYGFLNDPHRVDVRWDFPQLSDGFVAVRAGNGRIGMVAAKGADHEPIRLTVASIAAEDDFGSTIWDVVLQNTLTTDLELARVNLNYSLGENLTSTTVETTTTTTTLDPSAELVEVFVLGVNENDFYTNHFESLKNDIRGLVSDFGVETNCTFTFSDPLSCREWCYMTSDQDRGCVSFTVSVSTNIFCSYTNEQLRNGIIDNSDEWAKKYNAKRISVDDCMKEEKGWIIMAIVVPIATALVFIIGLIVMKCYVEPKRKKAAFRKASESEAAADKKKRRSSSGGRRRSSGSGEVRKAKMPYHGSTYPFDTHLEILDEE